MRIESILAQLHRGGVSHFLGPAIGAEWHHEADICALDLDGPRQQRLGANMTF